MNLRARILGLITLSALSLFSCEEDISTIGLPPENNLGIFFADIPLGQHASQVWVDGVNTRSTGIILSGAYQDPNFGLIEAKNYSEIGASSVTYNSSATFDSVVLEIRVSSVYGNNIENTSHNFEVYQLADSISLIDNGKLRRFTAETSEPLGQKIGEMGFEIYPDSIGLSFSDTGISLNDSIDDAADSAFFNNNVDSNEIYIYQHTARIDDAFGNQLFNELRTNQYDSLAETAALFKGIHIRPTSVNGAIVSYVTDTYSGLSFYYTEDGEQKKARYPLSTSRSYNNITPNKLNGWNGSDFDDLSQFYMPYETVNNKAYLMSGTNLLMKIDMSELRAGMRDSIPNSTVQSAEIIIDNLESSGGLTPPSNIRFWLTSADSLANKNYAVSSLPNLSNSGVVTATYNEDRNGYKLEAPLFIESLFSIDEYEFDQLIIGPATTNGNLPQSLIRRMAVNKDNIRLRFFYTTPNKDQ